MIFSELESLLQRLSQLEANNERMKGLKVISCIQYYHIQYTYIYGSIPKNNTISRNIERESHYKILLSYKCNNHNGEWNYV